MMKVGFAGLGIMGRHMSLNLLRAGFDVMVWNRTTSKIKPLEEAGAKAAQSLSALADANDVVITMLNDTPDVEQVILGPQGLVTGLTGGKIVIDMSTISPETTSAIGRKLKAFNCEMLDAPVSGGDSGAQKATLTIMVGGSKAVFDRAQPVFQAMGRNIVFCGKSGNGQRVKMINQVLCGLHTVALAEAFSLADKTGLDLEVMHQVVSSGAAGSWALDNYGPRLLKGDLTPGFKLGMQLKDLRIAKNAARKFDIHFEGLETAYRLFSKAVDKGLGEKGVHALVELYSADSKES